ncbi:hypothetical protein [Burkholderia cenocepacia]|uniref:hypothetical protein n=2 Tax=Burkholderia cenocepacia TaxID=95486 RepID=UPI0013DF2CC9|nr:hypothetical protein [Burkholderia cenocepacia]MCW3587350.1 hypothetical protein [Burkholderia cenocepacia]MCW3632554.1 hypothetical protein [Burkholderia cenocepacia]MCW5181785.1 hypothetical protein [Burkholderia cenocepacia]NGO98080.1 hypothetical protein [Burkholderia cenocepacia]
MTIMKKPAKKIGAIDKHAISVSLELAAAAIEPDEYSYRTVFKEMMPKLYMMRHRGMSFPQLHRVLNQAGFPIALTTVRTYYNECLVDMLEECQKYLKRMEKVIDGAEKTVVEVDRTNDIREVKSAMRSSVEEEGNRRAARAIAAIAGGALMAPTQDVATANVSAIVPATTGSHTPTQTHPSSAHRQQLPEPLLASGTSSSLPTAATMTSRDALPRDEKNGPALVAPDVAAKAAPMRSSLAATPAPTPLPAASAPGSASCLTNPEESQIEVRDGVPDFVLADCLLEHPAIPALMLTRAQRLFTGRLEYINAQGIECIEKGTEMMNRREWKAAIPASVGRTSADFVELDTSVIGRRKKD